MSDESFKQILSESSGVRVWCPGRPRTKGSLKPTHTRLGRGQCRVGLREDGEYSVPWKNAMINAIRRQCEVHRWPGPVEVHAFFRFEREGTRPPGRFDGPCPECGCTGGHPAWCPQSGLEAWPAGRQYGDEDKLRRNLLDALTQSGLIFDDSQVMGGLPWKRFVRDGEQPGVEFVVMPARSVEWAYALEQSLLSLARQKGSVQG